MQSVLDDFNERTKEVTDYMTFLKELEQKTIQLSKNGIVSEIESELAKTLKATAYLLLYNLIESTLRNAVQFIFDEIKANNVSFDNLKVKLKKIILQNVKKSNSDTLATNIIELTTDIIHASFDAEDLFAGNVDAKLIREQIADKYGFSSYTDYRQTRGGSDLLLIKTNRNNLAHGSVPFSEIGKDTNATELVEISERVIEYLRQILGNIEQYLVNQEYLNST